VDLFFIGDFEAKIWMRLTSYALSGEETAF